MYGHLFKDRTGHYLFIRQLGFGVSCQCQLVRHCETGELRVRKGAEDGPGEEFTNDAEAAKFLARHAQAAGVVLRTPTLFSDATIRDPRSGKTSRVSYWSLCNGGNLTTFVHSCWQRGVLVPRGLVLRMLQQVLETLHFMHTAVPNNPLLHCDLHGGNILLHFPPGSAVPDFHLMDFGDATFAADLPEADHTQLRWDCGALTALLESELIEITLHPNELDACHRVDYLSNRASTNPICVAYQMLARLDAQFRASLQHTRHTLTPPRVPDLAPVLAYVREHAMRALPELMLALQDPVTANNIFKQQAGDGGVIVGEAAPQLYRSVGAVLQARNVPGPWYVAEVGGDRSVRVVMAETYHRPNDDDATSETEAAWCGSEEEEKGDWRDVMRRGY